MGIYARPRKHYVQHGTDYKINIVIAYFCLSVGRHSYSRNFYSILMKFCTDVKGAKSKNAFVEGQNPMTSSPTFLQFSPP